MKKKKLLIVVLVLAIILGLGYLGINIYINSLLNKTNNEEEVLPEEIIINEKDEEPQPQEHKVLNIMLVGADNLDGDRYGSYREERSDVFKIISLDYTDKKIKLTSLDRDIVVWIPDKGGVGTFGRFNWAYSFGGSKYALNCINYNLDLDVTKYVSFSFAGFIDVIDTIGGIDIELTQAEVDFINEPTNYSTMSITATQGTNHLNGNDALTYARIRYLDSDFHRMERQNIVIKAVVDKLKSSSYGTLINVVSDCMPYISTNLDTQEIKDLIWDIIKFDLNDIETHTYPTNGYDDVYTNPDSMGGYLLNSYSNQVIDLHKFIYGIDEYKPSQTIYDNEKLTYETYGDYYEGSELIP